MSALGEYLLKLSIPSNKFMLVRFFTTKHRIDSCIRRNDGILGILVFCIFRENPFTAKTAKNYSLLPIRSFISSHLP